LASICKVNFQTSDSFRKWFILSWEIFCPELKSPSNPFFSPKIMSSWKYICRWKPDQGRRKQMRSNSKSISALYFIFPKQVESTRVSGNLNWSHKKTRKIFFQGHRSLKKAIPSSSVTWIRKRNEVLLRYFCHLSFFSMPQSQTLYGYILLFLIKHQAKKGFFITRSFKNATIFLFKISYDHVYPTAYSCIVPIYMWHIGIHLLIVQILP